MSKHSIFILSASPAPTRNQTVLVGCPPDEWHAFTPLLLSLLLRRRGLSVIYLGANVPTEQFSNTVKNIKAKLVVLVAQQLISAATLQHTALALSSQNIPVAFGGRIFSIHADLPEYISGYFLGNVLSTSIEEIELILNKRVKQPQPKAASSIYLAAYPSFVSKRGQIDLTIKELLEPLSISSDNINTAIQFLGDNIAAALQLGDISHVSAEVEWLKSLLQFHEESPQQLVHFMEIYSQAVDQNINGQGKPILEWLAAEVQKLKTD